MSPLQVTSPLLLPGACSLTLSYSSLARLSISSMSMGLWSLQPLAWLGLCLSRAACWERRVSSSTTLQEENQVLATPVKTHSDPRTLLVFIFQEYRKKCHDHNVLIRQNPESWLPHPGIYNWPIHFIYGTALPTNIFHCEKDKTQNFISELLEIGTLKFYAGQLRSCSPAYTVSLVQKNSYTYSPRVWIFLISTQINRRKSDLIYMHGGIHIKNSKNSR